MCSAFAHTIVRASILVESVAGAIFSDFVVGIVFPPIQRTALLLSVPLSLFFVQNCDVRVPRATILRTSNEYARNYCVKFIYLHSQFFRSSRHCVHFFKSRQQQRAICTTIGNSLLHLPFLVGILWRRPFSC